MPKRNICINGELFLTHDQELTRYQPGVFKRRGVFETLPVYKGIPEFLEEHLHRLNKGIRSLKLKNPYPLATMQDWVYKTTQANSLTHGRMRIMLFDDKGLMRLVIMVMPFKPVTQKQYKNGFHVCVQKTKVPANQDYSHCKSLDYGLYYKAFNQARRKGFDEAILLNADGNVMEGARTNIFWQKDNTLFTPSLKTGCLAGIMRAQIINKAKEEGMRVKQVQWPLDALQGAQHTFLTNSTMGIMPITTIK